MHTGYYPGGWKGRGERGREGEGGEREGRGGGEREGRENSDVRKEGEGEEEGKGGREREGREGDEGGGIEIVLVGRGGGGGGEGRDGRGGEEYHGRVFKCQTSQLTSPCLTPSFQCPL